MSGGCLKAREQFEVCRNLYEKLAKLVPSGQYYRYNDHWSFLTQRLVFLIALTIFLEKGFLVERNTAAEILGCKYIKEKVLILLLPKPYSISVLIVKTKHSDGFHLDIEDYLMGVLQLASELSRFATNAGTKTTYFVFSLPLSRYVYIFFHFHLLIIDHSIQLHWVTTSVRCKFPVFWLI